MVVLHSRAMSSGNGAGDGAGNGGRTYLLPEPLAEHSLAVVQMFYGRTLWQRVRWALVGR